MANTSSRRVVVRVGRHPWDESDDLRQMRIERTIPVHTLTQHAEKGYDKLSS